MERFYVKTCERGETTYLLDADQDGATMGIFTAETHAADAQHVADLLNNEQETEIVSVYAADWPP
jgi:hypothetical protein